MNSSDLKSLNEGKRASKTLAEILKIDFRILAKATFPKITAQQLSEIDSFNELGILKRMATMAKLLKRDFGKTTLRTLKSSPSDTVRGWAAFIIGQDENLSLREKLKFIRPFADDLHFGVREWAWMAVRSDIAADVKGTIQILKAWTKDDSLRVRRFASEAIRPRGVWAAHIQVLKADPKLALPVLEPLRADPDKYVRDSVGNWLNDASKDNPQWVKDLCCKWERESPVQETAYITKKARRTIKKSKAKK